MTMEPKKSKQVKPYQIHDFDIFITWGVRVTYLLLAALAFIYNSEIQWVLDRTWEYLCSTWYFNCVYFETWFAPCCYGLAMIVSYVMEKSGLFHGHKIDPSMKWNSFGLKGVLFEGIEYCTPLMLLDTFIVKKYYNVDPGEWEARRVDWIQHTRALPVEAPTFAQIVLQLIGSFIVYDIFFYCAHRMFHKNYYLYKYVHAPHHEHEIVQSRITNRLSIVERITLVLLANFALKVFNSHPLTRTIFVVLFNGWLVENHWGYDVPWTLDKVVPFGVVGGSAAHYLHHTHGTRNYQPFFTYIDKFLNRKSKTV